MKETHNKSIIQASLGVLMGVIFLASPTVKACEKNEDCTLVPTGSVSDNGVKWGVMQKQGTAKGSGTCKVFWKPNTTQINVYCDKNPEASPKKPYGAQGQSN